jgi:hypothetical protein
MRLALDDRERHLLLRGRPVGRRFLLLIGQLQ